MAEKTVSKYLNTIEKQFAGTDPVLQKTVKLFQALDAVEYDLGLIGAEESVARKSTWWPVMSVLGGYSPAKSEFLNRYFGIQSQSARHKFTVLQYTPQSVSTVLPGTALDADHRLPFYQIGRMLDQVAAGESERVNSYLELVTVNSAKLRGRLVIDTPVLGPHPDNSTTVMLRKHVIELSDLVLVFTDLFETDAVFNQLVIEQVVRYQDTNKFVFVVDHSELMIDPAKTQEIISVWQRRLAEFGIFTGQFLVLSQGADSQLLEQRLANLGNDRSYRVLANLQQSIRAVDDVVFEEVETVLESWKERSNATSLIVLSFIMTIAIFAEIAVGILEFLIDPILGPIIVALLMAVLIPLHLVVSKVYAKLAIRQLTKRQKQLVLTEDLPGIFEKSLGFWRTLLPITAPVGRNKKTRKKLNELLDQSKDLVQALNDQYSHVQPAYERVSAESYGSFEE
jgi:hypothetical protein